MEVLQRGTTFLKKQNVEQARLHMEHLLAHVLGIPRLELYLQFERQLTESERAPLRDLIRLRGQGTPLQHLLGTTEFFGRVFCSDHRGLIPRPETEQLIERALTYKNCHHILDIGTGSGIIAITLALEKNLEAIDAIDFSLDALALAQENAALNKVSTITWHHGDLFDALNDDAKEKKWDLIIANLPYIPADEIPTLSREVQHDPIMALDGGIDGLVLIKRLIEQAPMNLREGGHLLLEIGKNQETEIMDLLKQNNFRDIVALPDYQGVLRFVEANKP